MTARTILFAFAALVLAGCAQKSATVSERHPVFHPVSTVGGMLVSVQKSIADASRQELEFQTPPESLPAQISLARGSFRCIS